jgi:hypothetical protein
MKKLLLTSCIVLLHGAAFTQTTLYSQDFEGSDFDTYTLKDGAANPIPFTPIGTDYIAKGTSAGFPFGNAATGFTGNIVACEDYDGAGVFGIPYLETDQFTITGYTNLTLSIRFAAPRGDDGFIYESSDFVDVEYRIDAGTWQQAQFFGGGGAGRCYYDALDNGVTGSGDDVLTDQTSQVFLENLSGTGSNLYLRVYFGSQGSHEEFAIDDILVQGTPPCTDPDVPTITATPATVCPGGSSTLDWTGANLNDATDWYIYTSNCGTGLLTSQATNTLVVSPAVTTTYYIRGEDGIGCVDELTGLCGQVTVTVEDVTPPIITCPGTQSVNASPGVCTFTAGSVPPTSVSDNCGGVPTVTWSASGATTGSGTGNFGSFVLNVGTTIITYYATDASSNVDSCSFDIIILDAEAPNAVCQNINAYLDGAGNVSIAASDLDGGSTDNCGVPTFSASQTAFTCVDLGPNNVTLTVTDASSNTASCVAVVTVIDTIAPIITCPGTQSVNASPGVCTFSAGSVPPTSVSDNCGVPTVTWSASGATTGSGTGNFGSFVLNVGTTIITYYATDASSNVDSCSFDIIILDAEAPNAVCQNINAYLDGAGNVSIAASDLDGGSTDNCGVPTFSASQTAFTCVDLGPNNVTLTVTDASSNTASCIAVVTVMDTIAPIIVCPVDTTTCDSIVFYVPPVGTDNCSGANTVQTDGSGLASGSVFPIGTTTLEYTVTDGSGNSSICTFDIVIDPTPDAEFSYTQNGSDASFTPNHQSGSATYFWDFGDGNNSTQMSPTHTYSNGSNVVCLTVTENGCSAMWCDTIDFSVSIVENGPNDISFGVFPNPFQDFTNITYQLNTGSMVLLRVWDLNGKAISELVNGTQMAGVYNYTFNAAEAGVYMVQLIVDKQVYIMRMVDLN